MVSSNTIETNRSSLPLTPRPPLTGVPERGGEVMSRGSLNEVMSQGSLKEKITLSVVMEKG